MKLRILMLVLVGAAGVGASIALADSGKHGRHAETSTTATTTTGTTTTGTTTTTPTCQRSHVIGTAASPQTFTVTVTKTGGHSSFAPGQVVTVTVGAAGQTVRVNAEGCATASSLTAREVEVHAMSMKHVTTTGTTTTSTTSTTTTTQGHGDGGHHGHHHGHH
jgi:mucin-2